MRNSGRAIIPKKKSHLTTSYPSYAIYLGNSKMIINKNLTLKDQSKFLFAISDDPEEIYITGLKIDNYNLLGKNPLFKFIK